MGALFDSVHKLVRWGAPLTRDEARAAMQEILAGQASDILIASFLTALTMHRETVEELVGFAQAMRSQAADVGHAKPGDLVDTCGTGGDALGTFNISTVAAFVTAGAGVRVAKHGNRSATGSCGSADVMDKLGVSLALAPARMSEVLDQVGIVFVFAPAVHAATKHAGPARRELRFRTAFNLLGPLTNPLRATAQVSGVYGEREAQFLAEALRELGLKRGFVVHGRDGLDEISTTADTFVAEVRDGKVETYVVQPEDFGLPRATLADLAGGGAEDNARLLREILDGRAGPRRDIVLANAGAALVAAGRAADWKAGVAMARESIDSGKAREKLLQLQKVL